MSFSVRWIYKYLTELNCCAKKSYTCYTNILIWQKASFVRGIATCSFPSHYCMQFTKCRLFILLVLSLLHKHNKTHYPLYSQAMCSLHVDPAKSQMVFWNHESRMFMHVPKNSFFSSPYHKKLIKVVGTN